MRPVSAAIRPAAPGGFFLSASGLNRAKLLRRLLDEGHRALAGSQRREETDRWEAIARTSGALTGVYRPDYLADLRQEWPA